MKQRKPAAVVAQREGALCRQIAVASNQESIDRKPYKNIVLYIITEYMRQK